MSKTRPFLRFSSKISTSLKETLQHRHRMRAWNVHSYGDPLQLSTVRIPVISNPTDVLVKVDAASVNPIDQLMLAGYGKALLTLSRKYELELPLTVGRDFSGTIIDKGHGVGNNFKVGDNVYGFVPLNKPGSHAEAVIASKCHISHRPEKMSSVEAAAVPYAAMTAWSALYVTGDLFLKGTRGLKILILGVSGGVGTLALQILKSQGAVVVGTCATDAVPLVESLGADLVIDYKSEDYLNKVASEGRFDIILDCAKFGYKNAPSTWRYSKYVTLNSPLMLNTDKYGVIGGLAMSVGDLLKPRVEKGKNVRWGFFLPSGDGFRFIDRLVKDGKIRPVVHKTVKFEEMPTAFEVMSAGHLRGKVVVDYN